MAKRYKISLIITRILTLALCLTIGSTSCKKNDPQPCNCETTNNCEEDINKETIITGIWQFANIESEIKYEEGATDKNVITETTSADKSLWSRRVVIEADDSVISLKGKVSQDNFIKFEENRNFESSYTYEYTEDSVINDNEYIRYRTIVSEELTGIWSFLDNAENDHKKLILIYRTRKYETRKNKTVINTESEETSIEILHKLETKDESYSNGECSEIWTLKKLEDTEVIMEQELNQTLTHAVIVGQLATYNSAKGIKTQILTK